MKLIAYLVGLASIYVDRNQKLRKIKADETAQLTAIQKAADTVLERIEQGKYGASLDDALVDFKFETMINQIDR